MNGFWTEPIILSGEQAVEFMDSLRRPSEEYLDRRNEFFSQIDEEISIQRNGMDIEVEIAGLDLSFIDGMKDESRGVSLELSTEVNFVLEHKDTVGRLFRKFSERSTIIADYDYKDSMERVDCEYNVTRKSNPEAFVKNKTGAHMMKAHKIEQITFAA